MSLRFRRRMHIAPGVDLNLSNKSASVSVGPRGARFTVGPRDTRTTVGIPGTGLSYTATQRSTGRRQKPIGFFQALFCAIVLSVILGMFGLHGEWVVWMCLGISLLGYIGSRLPPR